MILFAHFSELARALRARRVSAVELANETCDLLETLGPRYNALATLTRDRALAEAAPADRALARKAARPLTGIPYGAKDLLAARGAPTTWGAPPYRDQVIGEDATVVAKLKRSGGVPPAEPAMGGLAGSGGERCPRPSLPGPGPTSWNQGAWYRRAARRAR